MNHYVIAIIILGVIAFCFLDRYFNLRQKIKGLYQYHYFKIGEESRLMVSYCIKTTVSETFTFEQQKAFIEASVINVASADIPEFKAAAQSLGFTNLIIRPAAEEFES